MIRGKMQGPSDLWMWRQGIMSYLKTCFSICKFSFLLPFSLIFILVSLQLVLVLTGLPGPRGRKGVAGKPGLPGSSCHVSYKTEMLLLDLCLILCRDCLVLDMSIPVHPVTSSQDASHLLLFSHTLRARIHMDLLILFSYLLSMVPFSYSVFSYCFSSRCTRNQCLADQWIRDHQTLEYEQGMRER